MYPHLVLEMLAAEHQRDALARVANEGVIRTIDSHYTNWWKPIQSTLRQIACANLRLRAALSLGQGR